jgi:rSAM/selenodomain-associated transferase 1
MAKASIPGRTKTRMVPPLSEEEAANLNTVFLRDAADNILSAATIAGISGWVAYAPAGSEAFFRSHLPGEIGLLETVAPTLGECLQHASATLLSMGYGAVCLINSDSPTLPVDYLVTAATALSAPGDRIVLGPSTDGGYYLVGMKRAQAGLFKDIAWSTDRVFSQTVSRAQALGLSISQLRAWYDVDDAETLQALIDEVLGGKQPQSRATPAPASATRAYLATLVEDFGLLERMHSGGARAGTA